MNLYFFTKLEFLSQIVQSTNSKIVDFEVHACRESELFIL
jgi:hypothetical protein